MDLGERIKAARLEAGLSQRQLCEGFITRNMLSQIENGSARPSMDTLGQLARRLGRPVSFFLEDSVITSPNQEVIVQAREALAAGDPEALDRALEAFQEPDDTFREEWLLLRFLCCQKKAEVALAKNQRIYAVELLRSGLALEGLYITRELRRKSLVLLCLAGEPVTADWDDDALLARAMQAPTPRRQLEILSAAEDQDAPAWNYLYAEAAFALGEYALAARHYEKADPSAAVFGRLEVCWRELGDYKQAYEYACRQRAGGEPYA